MTLLRLALLPLLLTGCTGPKPGPAPPAPAEAGVAAHYQKAYAALRFHPAVQAFAAEHLDPSETLAIAVSEELVPLSYSLVAADLVASRLGPRSPALIAAAEDSLAALAVADRFGPETDTGLPLLSMRQRRPLTLFFGKINAGRLPAQLYPNPYRRQGFATVRDGVPGLALLVVFEDGEVADIYTGRIAPE